MLCCRTACLYTFQWYLLIAPPSAWYLAMPSRRSLCFGAGGARAVGEVVGMRQTAQTCNHVAPVTLTASNLSRSDRSTPGVTHTINFWRTHIYAMPLYKNWIMATLYLQHTSWSCRIVGTPRGRISLGISLGLSMMSLVPSWPVVEAANPLQARWHTPPMHC